MADQTRIRPQQRGPNLPQAPAGAESRFTRRGEDPLAELARLIGQEDPFAEFSKEPQAQPRGPQQRAGNDLDMRVEPRGERYGQNGANGSRAVDRNRKSDPVYESYPEDNDGTYYADDAQPQRVAVAPAKNGRTAYSYGGGSIERHEPERIDSRSIRGQQPAARPPVHEVYEEQEVYDERGYEQQNSDRALYDDPRTTSRLNEVRRQADEFYEHPHAPEYQEYAEDEYAEDTEQVYVDPPRRSRRWVFVGVAAGIGLVVLAMTGLYGYRVIFGKHSASTPPTIRSAEAPNKIVPQANAENSGQKLIYDRAPGGNERVVSREEQPADIAQNRTAPRVTSPVPETAQPAGQVSAFAPPAPAQAAPPQVGAGMANANAPTGEPKRVRTMTVRSDGSMVANAAPAAPARPAPQAAAPANNSRANVAPLALNPTAQSAEEDPADANRAAARPAARTTAPAQNNQQPWAIAQQPAPTQAPQQQASNYVPAGSYVVQVSSQKSEADAQTAWRQMQSRYTNVLGSQQATIKRVDLGDRGTFYRAMVGPFTTRDQAYEMCQNLKAAGGECVVQRN